MRDTIYQVNFSGPRTNWLYRLEIVGADTSTLIYPDTVELNPGIIKKFEGKWEYENHFGMPKLLSFALTLDNDLMPLDLDNIFTDAVRDIEVDCYLSNPVDSTPLNPDNTQYDPGSKQLLSLRLSNSFKVWIDKSGTGNEYVCVFRGMQKPQIEIEYDPTDRVTDIEVDNIATVAMQLFSMSYLESMKYLKTSEMTLRKNAYQYWYKEPTASYIGYGGVILPADGSFTYNMPGIGSFGYFAFVKYSRLFDHMEILLGYIESLIQRMPYTYQKAIISDLVTYDNYMYKQDYNVRYAGKRGGVCTFANLEFIAFIYDHTYDKSVPRSGFCESKTGAAVNHKTLWDWFSDYSKSEAGRFWYLPAFNDLSTSKSAYYLAKMFLSLENDVYKTLRKDGDFVEFIYDVKITSNAGVVSRSSVAPVEAMQSDVNQFENNVASSRADEEITCPVVMNTTAGAGEYKYLLADSVQKAMQKAFEEDFLYLAGESFCSFSFDAVRFNTLYYFDNATGIEKPGAEKDYFKVHDFGFFNFGNNWISSDFHTYIAVELPGFTTDAECIVFQKENAKSPVLSKSLLGIFSGTNQTAISAKCSINAGNYGDTIGVNPGGTDPGGSGIDRNMFFDPSQGYFKINLSEFAPPNNPNKFVNTYQNYRPYSVTIDMITEEVEFEAIALRGQNE